MNPESSWRSYLSLLRLVGLFLPEILPCCLTVHCEFARCVKLPRSLLLDCLGCSDLCLKEDVWQDRNMQVPGEEKESLRPFFL